MKTALFFLPLLLITVTCSSEKKEKNALQKTEKTSTKQQLSPFFSQLWNQTFHLRTTETGEILTIGAVFSDDRQVFVYDLAENTVVSLDAGLKVTSTVKLNSIGRKTYAGDDFIVKDSQFIFLNGVDRRLEIFHRTTGKHFRSVPVPSDLLAGVKKRSHRIINRLFLDGNQLLIGNEYHLVPFGITLGKQAATIKVETHGRASLLSATGNRRWALYRKKEPVVVQNSLLKKGSLHAGSKVPETHHPVNGKRFFTLDGRLYSIVAGKDSVKMAEVK
jgi:hypothetical protein